MSVADTATLSIAAEADARPQIALSPSGVPTWALALGAGAIGAAMLLMLNAQRARLAVTMPTRSYTPSSVPALPRALDRAPGEAFGPADRPSGPQTAYARIEPESAFARPMRWSAPAPAAFSAPLPPASRGASGMGSEGAPNAMRFPSEPMPVTPTAPGGGGNGPFGHRWRFDGDLRQGAAPPGLTTGRA